MSTLAKKTIFPNLESLEIRMTVKRWANDFQLSGAWGLVCPRLVKLKISCSPDILDRVCELCPKLCQIDFSTDSLIEGEHKFFDKVVSLALYHTVDCGILKRFVNLTKFDERYHKFEPIGDISELPSLNTLSVTNWSGLDTSRLANLSELTINLADNPEILNKINSPHLKVLTCSFEAEKDKSFFVFVSIPNLEYLTLSFGEPTPKKLVLFGMQKLVSFNLAMRDSSVFNFDKTFLSGVPNLREFRFDFDAFLGDPVLDPEIFLATPNLEKLVTKSDRRFAGLKKLCFASQTLGKFFVFFYSCKQFHLKILYFR